SAPASRLTCRCAYVAPLPSKRAWPTWPIARNGVRRRRWSRRPQRTDKRARSPGPGLRAEVLDGTVHTRPYEIKSVKVFFDRSQATPVAARNLAHARKPGKKRMSIVKCSRFILMVSLAAVYLFAACKRDKGSSKHFTIAVVPQGSTHEFWKSIHAGAIKASRALARLEGERDISRLN